MDSLEVLIIVIAALFIDALTGEASNRFHPVAWLGAFISLQLRIRPENGKAKQVIYGVAIVLFTLVIIVAPLYFLLSWIKSLNVIIYLALSAYLFKNTFALRGLWEAVQKVKNSLQTLGLEAARHDVRALVHRNPNQLADRQLISATVESCAENLCDSFVAPLFYFAIFGVPGAIAYRIINTFDAMIGYHDEWEFAGKFAARLDDMVNYIPARLSAILILAAAPLCQADASSGWKIMLSYHSKTESPNAGWTMSAMAGSLNAVLEKPGHYRLGEGGHELSLSTISDSQSIMLTAASMWSCIIIVKELLVAAIS